MNYLNVRSVFALFITALYCSLHNENINAFRDPNAGERQQQRSMGAPATSPLQLETSWSPRHSHLEYEYGPASAWQPRRSPLEYEYGPASAWQPRRSPLVYRHENFYEGEEDIEQRGVPSGGRRRGKNRDQKKSKKIEVLEEPDEEHNGVSITVLSE